MLRNCYRPLSEQTSAALENIIRDKNKGQVAQRPEFQVKPPSAFFESFVDVIIRNQQNQNPYQDEQDEKNVFGGTD